MACTTELPCFSRIFMRYGREGTSASNFQHFRRRERPVRYRQGPAGFRFRFRFGFGFGLGLGPVTGLSYLIGIGHRRRQKEEGGEKCRSQKMLVGGSKRVVLTVT
ncbi:hypothetical protein HAX54_030025 [Datura stramonium]|uniref:Uncharacterized protein n=1 Tax=Datura stramonium TaxID=4076 RepID=A0ABS8V928_DATST|nr:hypothetical protein [Datura stramonium]